MALETPARSGSRNQHDKFAGVGVGFQVTVCLDDLGEVVAAADWDARSSSCDTVEECLERGGRKVAGLAVVSGVDLP
jgi:hypothetical protein